MAHVDTVQCATMYSKYTDYDSLNDPRRGDHCWVGLQPPGQNLAFLCTADAYGRFRVFSLPLER